MKAKSHSCGWEDLTVCDGVQADGGLITVTLATARADFELTLHGWEIRWLSARCFQINNRWVEEFILVGLCRENSVSHLEHQQFQYSYHTGNGSSPYVFTLFQQCGNLSGRVRSKLLF